jgi:hypothetical protein
MWVGMGAASPVGSGAAAVGLSARLGAAQEVPKPVRVPAAAGGAFSGRLVRQGAGGTLSWRLTFRGLSGQAVAAHIHRAQPGRPGPVAVALCGPCRSGATGTAKVTARTIAALLGGGAYVNVHTKRNAGGEIRGQIARTAKPPPPPPTSTTSTTDTTGTTGTTETVTTTYAVGP